MRKSLLDAFRKLPAYGNIMKSRAFLTKVKERALTMRLVDITMDELVEANKLDESQLPHIYSMVQMKSTSNSVKNVRTRAQELGFLSKNYPECRLFDVLVRLMYIMLLC